MEFNCDTRYQRRRRTDGTLHVLQCMNYEQQIKVLEETIDWFAEQIEPHDCGWMYTTIDGLKYRIKELRKKR